MLENFIDSFWNLLKTKKREVLKIKILYIVQQGKHKSVQIIYFRVNIINLK